MWNILSWCDLLSLSFKESMLRASASRLIQILFKGNMSSCRGLFWQVLVYNWLREALLCVSQSTRMSGAWTALCLWMILNIKASLEEAPAQLLIMAETLTYSQQYFHLTNRAAPQDLSSERMSFLSQLQSIALAEILVSVMSFCLHTFLIFQPISRCVACTPQGHLGTNQSEHSFHLHFGLTVSL